MDELQLELADIDTAIRQTWFGSDLEDLSLRLRQPAVFSNTVRCLQCGRTLGFPA
jgi:hypothetical protein